MAILYTVFAVMAYLNIVFREYGYVFNLVLDIIITIFTTLIIIQYLKDDANKWNKVLAFIYVILCATRTVQKESFVGLLLFIILFFILLVKRKTIKSFRSVLGLILLAVTTFEIISLVDAFAIIEFNKEIDLWVTTKWIDLLFVIALAFWMGSVKLHSFIVRIIPIAFILFEVIGCVILMADIYNDGICMEMNSSLLEDGMQISLFEANNKENAVAVEYTNIGMKNNPQLENQTITLEKTGEEGYWKLKSSYQNFIDIESAKFEDKNGVCVWQDNGGINQMWKFEDVDAENGIVRVASYMDDFALSYDSSTNGMIITSDRSDNNQYFYLKGHVHKNRPIIQGALYNSYTKMCSCFIIGLCFSLLLGFGVIFRSTVKST